MLARVWSCALAGLEGEIVQVEVDVHHGLPHTTIVGLPGAAVRESKDRLYAALRNAGFSYPLARITVNLAPADVRKAGPAYDLPIALGILAASDQLDVDLDDVTRMRAPLATPHVDDGGLRIPALVVHAYRHRVDTHRLPRIDREQDSREGDRSAQRRARRISADPFDPPNDLAAVVVDVDFSADRGISRHPTGREVAVRHGPGQEERREERVPRERVAEVFRAFA